MRNEAMDEFYRLDAIRNRLIASFGKRDGYSEDAVAQICWLFARWSELDYMDNQRIADVDNPSEVAAYKKAIAMGCCGSNDVLVFSGGKIYMVGCNYGH